MAYPDNLDTFAYPNSSQKMNDPAATQSTIVGALNTAITAIEAKVGVDNSAITTSLDYKTSRLTAKGDILTHDGTNPIKIATGTDGYMLISDSTKATGHDWIAPTSGGTVTTVSVTTANGIGGTVATSTTTPAITLTTSVNGIAKGNGTAFSTATAGTDYSVPTGVETLTNKTLTSPTINSPTITNPTINVGSDANGDIYTRAGGTLARKAIGTTGDFLTVSGGAVAWANPFAYEGTLNIPTATSNGGGVVASTHYQTADMTVGEVALIRGTSGYAKVRYSPDNATWTDIYSISTAGNNTFPLLMRKGYYYYVEVDSPVGGSASSATLTALF